MTQEKDPQVEQALADKKIVMGEVRAWLANEIHDELSETLNDRFHLGQILDERYEWGIHTWYDPNDPQTIKLRFSIYRDDNV